MSANFYSQFDLSEAFFSKVVCKRSPLIPDPISLPITVEIKVADNEFPKVQAVIRVFSEDNQNLELDLEIVGIFNFLGDNQEIGQQSALKYIGDKGLFMLFPMLAQMVKTITSQMGMPPLNIKTPINFEFNPTMKPISVTEE